MGERRAENAGSAAADPDRRWQARPAAAFAVRAAIAMLPLAGAFAAGVALTTAWPRPVTTPSLVAWWTAGLLAAGAASYLVARAARRLLPLATLLRLSLSFPDRTPSRFAVALRAGGISDLRATRERLAREDVPLGEAVTEALVLATALTRHDRATRGHSERVRALTDVLAIELGLTTHQREQLRWAGLLHDVGKVAVPASILNKPGALNDDEWRIMRTHPLEGERLAAPLRPWLGEWTEAIGQHHERFNGSGYPYGLSGTDINFGARIVAVADTFEVMTSARSYKRPLPAQAARVEISSHAGDLFDPDVARALLNASLGKLRWGVGPVAWLATSPLFVNLRDKAVALGNAAPAAASAVTGGVLAAVLAVGPGVTPRAAATPQPEARVVPRSAASPWPQRAAVATVPAAAAPPLPPAAPLPPPAQKAPATAPAPPHPQPGRPEPLVGAAPVVEKAPQRAASEAPPVALSVDVGAAPVHAAVGADVNVGAVAPAVLPRTRVTIELDTGLPR